MQEKRAVTIPAAVVVSVVILLGAVVDRFGLPEIDFGPLSYNANEYQKARIDPQEKDTDGDGLKDTDEALWGTDPNVRDTDKDGTLDYDEVVTGRDPLTPGPYDVIDSTKLPLTTRLVEDAIVGYASLEDAGALTDNNQESLVTNLVDVYSKELSFTPYTAEDLKLVQTSDVAVAQYHQNLLRIFQTFDDVKERETVVLLRAIENDSPAELAKIDAAVAIYTNALTELAALRVPSNAAGIHVAFLNSLQSLTIHLQNMRVATSDPLRALVGVAQFSEIEGAFIEASADLAVYLAYYE